jgi:sulfopyruvate decarboxylase subunit alpha
LHAAGSRHVVYVPDNPLSHVMRVLREQYADVTATIATREEEAFGIAAGLYLGGKRPTVMLQSSVSATRSTRSRLSLYLTRFPHSS